ncbi:hypothetical protein KIPB_015608, partial [Kipferlia bialata]|eukprot:g15608.t1
MGIPDSRTNTKEGESDARGVVKVEGANGDGAADATLGSTVKTETRPTPTAPGTQTQHSEEMGLLFEPSVLETALLTLEFSALT